jgi:hypothetical protein
MNIAYLGLETIYLNQFDAKYFPKHHHSFHVKIKMLDANEFKCSDVSADIYDGSI